MADNRQPQTLREIVRVIAMRFWGMVIVFMLVVGAVSLATYLAPRWYRSEVKLQAKPTRMVSALESSNDAARDQISLFVVMQREIIMSNYVLASAVMKLEEGAKAKFGARGAGGRLDPWYSASQVAKYIDDNRRKMAKIQKRVRVLTPGGQQASFAPSFTIQVDWPEEPGAGSAGLARQRAADSAQRMAELIKEAYLIRYTEIESNRAKLAADFLQKQSLERAQMALKAAEDDKENFVKNTLKGDLLQVVHLEGQGGGMETGVALLSTRFRGEINSIDEKTAITNALQAAVKTELARANAAEIAIPDAVTEANPVLATMQTRMVTLRLQYNEMEPKYTVDHQQLINIKRQLALAEKDLRDELTKQATRMGQDLAVFSARRSTLAALVKTDRDRLDALAINAATYDRLQEKVRSARTNYNAELDRFNSAKTARDLAATRVLVTEYDPASKPEVSRPRRPIVLLNMLIALVGGLVLAFIYAFMADHFDNSIKSPEDAMRQLDLPVLASVPIFKKRFIQSG